LHGYITGSREPWLGDGLDSVFFAGLDFTLTLYDGMASHNRPSSPRLHSVTCSCVLTLVVIGTCVLRHLSQTFWEFRFFLQTKPNSNPNSGSKLYYHLAFLATTNFLFAFKLVEVAGTHRNHTKTITTFVTNTPVRGVMGCIPSGVFHV
jgi:hypothetical protein